ncbi:MAG TPA: hypothetical protein VFP36_10800, partial [Usitatibacter sp.]|nr:hypothetical protein [Usitatibacter sp.]
MNTPWRLRPLSLAVSLAIASLAPLPLDALAANPQPVIDYVTADSGLVNLTVQGHNFSSVRRLAITISGDSQALDIVSTTNTSIVALLPLGIQPGSYVVTLADGANEQDFFVTLGSSGAVGPTGPMGPTGATGATGTDGSQGPVG